MNASPPAREEVAPSLPSAVDTAQGGDEVPKFTGLTVDAWRDRTSNTLHVIAGADIGDDDKALVLQEHPRPYSDCAAGGFLLVDLSLVKGANRASEAERVSFRLQAQTKLPCSHVVFTHGSGSDLRVVAVASVRD